jgi:hemerythrin-like domain-containing protein
MPVTIGGKPESDFRNPIGMLSDCHRRIERFLAGLITIAEGAGGNAIPEANRALFETGLRYFREAAPKHTLDEEESLFPRLLKYRAQQTEDTLTLLDHLEAEHIKASDRHRIVDRLGTEWLARGRLSSGDADLLRANLHKLKSDYEEHIAVEDTRLFPLAARLLSTEDLNVMGEEMAARRGLRSGR